MLKINFVTILGANGIMGSLCGGLIAAFGNTKVFMVSRTIEKSKDGINRAIESVRSDVIKENLIPLTYDDLSKCIPKSNWVLESASEDINIKHFLNNQIAQFVKPKTIISTTSSGLSITDLASDFNKNIQKYYFGTHFFNPPYKMLLCEVIPNPDSDKKTQKDLVEYLEKTLLRQVIISRDTPAFIGNRIGFEILNEALVYGEKYGTEYIDYLLGGITGRTMPPFETIDLIGLDIYKAVIENMGLKVPDCIDKLISEGKLGKKTGSGLYSRQQSHREFNINLIENVKREIKEGKYKEAISMIRSSNSKEAKIIQYFFARYIHMSFSIIGSVAKNVEDVDKAMAYGFNWLPPSALIDLIGGKLAAVKLLNKFNFHTPNEVSKYKDTASFYSLQNSLDYRSFLRSI